MLILSESELTKLKNFRNEELLNHGLSGLRDFTDCDFVRIRIHKIKEFPELGIFIIRYAKRLSERSEESRFYEKP